jgi:hypothetical protein
MAAPSLAGRADSSKRKTGFEPLALFVEREWLPKNDLRTIEGANHSKVRTSRRAGRTKPRQKKRQAMEGLENVPKVESDFR